MFVVIRISYKSTNS